ncbi:MAG: adenylosuccinate synthetase [Spirochaetes bacterium]|nr:adenylosuccinate synthetase [Spirochaetota bacterium]
MKRRVVVVVGLGFGDEGKGAACDFLARTRGIRVAVRFSGGAQAAHHVVLPDGRFHRFSQFGSVMLVPGTATLLGPGVLVEPLALLREARALAALGVAAPERRISVDGDCVIVTPFHRALGRVKEILRGPGRYGSTGMGIGEAAADRDAGKEGLPRFRDLYDGPALLGKLRRLRDGAIAEASRAIGSSSAGGEAVAGAGRIAGELAGSAVLQDLADGYAHARARLDGALVDIDRALPSLARGGAGIVFEGSQGLLLDPGLGFPPHVTRTDSTAALALELAARLLPGDDAAVIGCLRTYAHRHGPGPLPTEDPALASSLPEPHNTDARWQGPFRVGVFDLVLSRYAVRAIRPDAIVLSHLDRVASCGLSRAVRGYLVDDGSSVPAGLESLDDAPLRAGEVMSGFLLRCKPGAFADFLPVTDGIAPGDADENFTRGAEEALGVPVAITANGPTWLDRAWRRPEIPA